MWKPARVDARLLAAPPITMVDAHITEATCAGRSRAVGGRYTAFRCAVVFDNYYSKFPGTVDMRVLPVGSGKLCVRAVTPGIYVVEGRACP